MRRWIWMAGSVGAAVVVASACAQPGDDFDWVTIGDPGNPAWFGESPFGPPDWEGRGSVDYTFRISRFEVTTAQWMEFVNTFSTQGDQYTHFLSPREWGAEEDLRYNGPGRRWRLSGPNTARFPVAGMTWRDAAMYANWLHNGKSDDFASLEYGAYDASTWGDNGFFFTDDPTHLPGAKFWIPTLDEWMKAVHYDPNRHGPGEEGWWTYPNMSDEVPAPGPPGVGETSAGWDVGEIAWRIPLGSYGEVSPWGLLDTSGGASEWLEEVMWPGSPRGRGVGGGYAGDAGWYMNDHVSVFQGHYPDSGGMGNGLRLVTVPAPSAGGTAGIAAVCLMHHRRRRGSQ